MSTITGEWLTQAGRVAGDMEEGPDFTSRPSGKPNLEVRGLVRRLMVLDKRVRDMGKVQASLAKRLGKLEAENGRGTPLRRRGQRVRTRKRHASNPPCPCGKGASRETGRPGSTHPWVIRGRDGYAGGGRRAPALSVRLA